MIVIELLLQNSVRKFKNITTLRSYRTDAYYKEILLDNKEKCKKKKFGECYFFHFCFLSALTSDFYHRVIQFLNYPAKNRIRYSRITQLNGLPVAHFLKINPKSAGIVKRT